MQYTKEDLKIMQSWSLGRKIQVTQTRIMEWYMRWGGQVYISFSGGKDSTVLLDLARRVYPDIEAVFCDTGLEYPEVRQFVKQFDNVTWLRPEIKFYEVIKEYGYLVISKEVANTVDYGRTPSTYRWKKLHGLLKTSKGEYSFFNCEKWQYLLYAPFKISARCCNVMKKKTCSFI